MIDRVARNVTRNPLMRYLAVGLVCAVATEVSAASVTSAARVRIFGFMRVSWMYGTCVP